MTSNANDVSRPAVALAAWAIAAIASATLAGAWFFEFVLDIKPCPMCLQQRYAYYLVIPLAIIVALAARRNPVRSLVKAGLWVLLLATLANAVFGAFHAGVEWGFWEGPTACSGAAPLDFGKASSLLQQLDSVKVVRCDEVQWSFLGLSLAGYNALISLLMAALAALGLRATR